ncbi:MAG: 6-phosphofructokinase [Anaerolineae bacterium]|nr:6-phosphofructokinase [Anaerolineae bacterium]
MSDTTPRGSVGILVGGGPAPGLNGVIHAVTITAIVNGLQVYGIMEGFKYLAAGEPQFVPLTIPDVSRIHLKGGTILKTSRANPTGSVEALRNVVEALRDAGITYLVTTGGDDTAFSAYKVSQFAKTEMSYDLRSVHVPKTIDNDLPLPEGIPTFGYETARHEGTQIVKRIMEDALSTVRWYVIVAMGRKAGHLALGIGKSAGATLTLIPEEWGGKKARLQHVADLIAASVIKRLANGQGYGVALVAEGVMEIIDHADLSFMENIERDEHGHPRLAEINSAAIIKRATRDVLEKVGVKMTIVDKEVGYELRCADPCAFDIDYTRTLGQAAVEFLLKGRTDAMITIQDNEVMPIAYTKMMDSKSGRTGVRLVNTDSLTFHSARKLMVRLERQDLEDASKVAQMAACTKLSPEEFVRRFGYLVGMAPCPYSA